MATFRPRPRICGAPCKMTQPQRRLTLIWRDALAHLGETEQAIPLLEKAIDLDPYNPLSRRMLIVDLIQAKQYEKAETALEQYSAIFPQDDAMRKALARARASSPQP